MDNNNDWCSFIDLSNAFDNVNNALILSNLAFHDNKDRRISLASSYLIDRQQYIVYDKQSFAVQQEFIAGYRKNLSLILSCLYC